MTQVVDPPEVALVDPRLRARRIEVRRAEGRRRLRRLVALAVFTVVCLGAWGISRSPLLDVDHIEVTGLQRLDVDAVVAASGIAVGDALVDVDLGRASRQVLTLPWVASVEVDRSWWGTVEVRVVEREPVAVTRSAEGPALLVDRSGWVLDVATPADLEAHPHVVGTAPHEPGERIAGLDQVGVDLVVRAGPSLLQWIDHLVVADDGLWIELRPEAVTAAGGTPGHPGRVQLGDGRGLADQLVAAETVLARVDLSCLREIDVRVPASPVVRRVDDCAHGEPA